MKQRFLLAVIVMCGIVFVIQEEFAAVCDYQRSCKVKVLLQVTSQPTETYRLQAPEGFIISDPCESTMKCRTIESTIQVGMNAGSIALNNKRYRGRQLLLVPCGMHDVSLGDRNYAGGLLIAVEQEKLYLINIIDLEEYIYSVLRTESWPGWPLEINKAFAIASRSYALAHMWDAQKRKALYHIKNTNAHQTYQGNHSCPVLRAAVDQTRGVFLTYNNLPIIAMFDCCCGGIIPAHIAGFDFEKTPYLKRTYRCKFCQKSRIFKWEKQYTIKEFEEEIRKKISHIRRIKNIMVHTCDDAGLVQEVVIHMPHKKLVLSGKEFYGALKPVKSFCFDIKKRADKICITGKGFGHHLGMCQWGAREMVREGWSYRQILQFYYPGTTFMKLYQEEHIPTEQGINI